MILSQLVRGAAESLALEEGELGGASLARALRAGERGRLRRGAPPGGGHHAHASPGAAAEGAEAADGEGLAAVLEAALEGGRRGGRRDPGAARRAARGRAWLTRAGWAWWSCSRASAPGCSAARSPRPSTSGAHGSSQADHVPSRYRYCTSFLVEGSGIDLDALEASLLSLGDSLLVMGDAAQAKVHVHTDAPERAAEAAGAWGEVTGLRVRRHAPPGGRARRPPAARPRRPGRPAPRRPRPGRGHARAGGGARRRRPRAVRRRQPRSPPPARGPARPRP